MKRLFLTFALLGLIFVPVQFAEASPVYPIYTEPVAIEKDLSNFSLNPFTGFRNCNPCKVKKAKCDPCEVKKAECNQCEKFLKPCEKCVKAF